MAAQLDNKAAEATPCTNDTGNGQFTSVTCANHEVSKGGLERLLPPGGVTRLNTG